MPNHHCFLCASDEGVFLDTAKGYGRKFRDQLETCLSVKVDGREVLSNKLCYKCAYELAQCDTFIHKYKKARTADIAKRHKRSCILCFESVEKGYIFDLTKDEDAINNPLQKIHDIFNDDFAYDGVNTLICLSCRYSLDILFDLKSIFHENTTKLRNGIGDHIDYLNFPKTETTVVSRKTTITEANRIKLYNTPSDSDSDSTTMARGHSRVSRIGKRKSPSKLKLRICGKCDSSVENGVDMYRFHRSRLTVCKNCWTTMDPGIRISKKQRHSDSSKTKSCTVFLKDVLTNSAFKDEKVYRVEKDEQGNKVYIITDESSENESKYQTDSPKHSEKAGESNAELKIKTRKRPLKGTRSNSTDSDYKSNKKMKSNTANESADAAKSLQEIEMRRSQRQRKNRMNSTQSSDSDVSLSVRILRQRPRVRKETPSTSDADSDSKHSQKRVKRVSDNSNAKKSTDVNSTASSNEEGNIRRETRITSTSCMSPHGTKSKKEQDTKTRSGSISDSDTPALKFKSPGPKRKRLLSVSSSTRSEKKVPQEETVMEEKQLKEEDEQETTEYTCTECNIVCENRMVGMVHQLTHFKQVELKLSKVNMSTEAEKGQETTDEAKDDLEAKGDDKRESPVAKFPTPDPEVNEEDIGKSTQADTDLAIVPDEDGPEESTDMTVDSRETEDKENRVISKIQSDEPVTEQTQNIENDDPAKDVEVKLVEEQKETEIESLRLSISCENETNDSNHDCTEASNAEESMPDEKGSSKDGHNEAKAEETVSEQLNEDISLLSETGKDTNETGATPQDKSEDNLEEEIQDKLNIETKAVTQDSDDGLGSTNNVTVTELANSEKDEPAIKACNEEEIETPCKNEQNGIDEKDVESETDIKIVDTGSSENSVEPEMSMPSEQCVEIDEDLEDIAEVKLKDNSPEKETADTEVVEIMENSNSRTCNDAEVVESGLVKHQSVPIKTFDNDEKNEYLEKDTLTLDDLTNDNLVDGTSVKENTVHEKAVDEESGDENSKDESMNAVKAVLKEVFDTVTTEVERKETSPSLNVDDPNDDPEAETLENISREIRNSADMPSLDPISAIETDNDVLD